MVNREHTIIIILFLSHQFSTADSYRCYSCCSSADINCLIDPRREEFEVDCILGACYKVTAEKHKKIGVMRGCSKESYCQDLKKRLKTCDVCYTDLCNSSMKLRARYFITLAMMLTTTIFR